MFNKTRLKRQLNKKIGKIEKTKNDYVSYVINANFGHKLHNMEVKDKEVFNEVYQETYLELLPLEQADLHDYWNLGENGRTNKTRRNLLR